MADFEDSLPVLTENDGDVVAKIGDGTTPAQQLGVDANGRITVNINDISKGVQTNDVKVTLDGEAIVIAAGQSVQITDGTDIATISEEAPKKGLDVFVINPELNVTDNTAIHTNAQNEISGVAAKVIPTGTDLVIIEDSEAAFIKKKVLLSGLFGGTDHSILSNLGFNNAGHLGFQKETYADTSNPTANNDSVDTASIGITFRNGDLWLNTSTSVLFVCDDATPTAAVWGIITTDTPLVEYVDFKLDQTPPGTLEGRVSWNNTDLTLNIDTGLGPVLQAGQEFFVIVHNATGAQLDNGTPVYPVGAVGGRPSVAKANASTHVKILGEVVILTMDIPNGEIGIATKAGKVRDIDTSMWNFGDTLWVGTTDGALTNVKPEFPDYVIQVGGVTVADAVNGEIGVTLKGIPEDTIVHAWDGSIRETLNFTVNSDGVTVTGSLENNDGVNDLTLIFSDGLTMLDVTPALTVVLTAGSTSVLQNNYVYIDKATKTLQVSTSDWPVTIEHVRIAHVALLSAALTQTNGALRNQNWNDHIKSIADNGHLLHIADRLRQEFAKWEAGVEGAVDVTGANEVFVRVTAGMVYQLHRQIFPVLDMNQRGIDAVNQGSKIFTISGEGDLTSVFPDGRDIKVNGSTGNDGMYTVASTFWVDPDFRITVNETIPSAVADGDIGDNIHIVNDFVTPYETILDLADNTIDASGNSLLNTSFSIVVWGAINRSGQPSHLMANLPTATYSKNFPAQAVSDASNFSVYSIPKVFQGVGFLIARFTFIDNAGVWSLHDTEDLRGKIPNTTAGGGGGGAGVTTFLGLTDTPSAYTGQANKLPKVNVGETALEFVDFLHNLGGAEHNTDTLANLNSKVSDATLIDTSDSRLSDARTPTSHNTSHQSGGGDAIKLDDLAAPDDNTDLDATTLIHGLLLKLGGGTTNFLRADGTWNAPPSHTRLHGMTGVLDHSATAYRIFYSDGSGNVQALVHGDDGDMLFSGGPSSNPFWAPTPSSFTPILQFNAYSFINPDNSDFAVNSIAWQAKDSTYNRQAVRVFPDATERGVAFAVRLPADAISINLTFHARATGSDATGSTTWKLYASELADNGTLQAWANVSLNALDLSSTINYRQSQQSVALSALSLTAGNYVIFELTRDGSSDAQGFDVYLTDLYVTWDVGTTVYVFTENNIDADMFIYPDNSDWAIDEAPSLDLDDTQNRVKNALFDPTTEEAVGLYFKIPEGATNIIIDSVWRTDDTGSGTIKRKLYVSELANDSVPEAFTSVNLSDLTAPASENYQFDSDTVSLASISAVAGNYLIIQYSRNATDVGDTYAGDFRLLHVRLRYS